MCVSFTTLYITICQERYTRSCVEARGEWADRGIQVIERQQLLKLSVQPTKGCRTPTLKKMDYSSRRPHPHSCQLKTPSGATIYTGSPKLDDGRWEKCCLVEQSRFQLNHLDGRVRRGINNVKAWTCSILCQGCC